MVAYKIENRDSLCLMEYQDRMRHKVYQDLSCPQRAERGQFFTPTPVALQMAELLQNTGDALAILDAGAGIGTLSAAAVVAICQRENPPRHLHITAYELESHFLPTLQETLQRCHTLCLVRGIEFSFTIRPVDFLEEVAQSLSSNLFAGTLSRYDVAILNPPYRKIHTRSAARAYMREMGMETTNLYTGFLHAACHLLKQEGELIAIVPRSFCNGRYFRPFRSAFVRDMAIKGLYLFDSRTTVFREEAVLQETLIVHARKSACKPAKVSVATITGGEQNGVTPEQIPYLEVVQPHDKEQFIRIFSEQEGAQIARKIQQLPMTLKELGLTASTGRVVDFRVKEHLVSQWTEGTVPLLYPLNLEGDFVAYPKIQKKPQALRLTPMTQSLCVPKGNYVLIKRFTSKEQKRRVVAGVFEEHTLSSPSVAFENHLNFVHCGGQGMERALAFGLTYFLNSSLVDTYFRQFSGHTQVNVTDLMNLRYPSKEHLRVLGEIGLPLTPQEREAFIEQMCFGKKNSHA